VEPGQIVADYVLTRNGLPEVMDRLSRAAPYVGMLSGWTIERFAPRAEKMLALLDWLAAQGGAHLWLAGNGVRRSAMDEFRAEMLGG
jgi:hypothetical protein